jgi:GT2 family glycosyltransferase
VTGAALAIRADLFRQLGGFDDETYIGGYFEDVDLAAKVVKAGYQVWYQPQATFIHIVGTSGGNPNFHHNAMKFKERWVDTGYIEPDTSAIKERFW